MKRGQSRQPYKAFLIAADGTRKRVKAHGIAIELGRGQVLELSLAPPPNHGGGLPIRTDPPPSAKPDVREFPRLVVRPGAANVIHVFVERVKGRFE